MNESRFKILKISLIIFGGLLLLLTAAFFILAHAFSQSPNGVLFFSLLMTFSELLVIFLAIVGLYFLIKLVIKLFRGKEND